MSIIIKGFDTDGNCLHCFFQSEDTDRCLLTDDDIPLYGKGHPASCPLFQLPEGHGRLIDADALNYTMLYKENWLKGTGVEAPAVWACDIDAAPTIVPAEGGNGDG